jgi:hypothetical protein
MKRQSMKIAAAIALGFAAAVVSAETYTLDTYYPSPAGIYTTLSVSSNAYLAKDGGGVGIGTKNLKGKALQVEGGAGVQALDYNSFTPGSENDEDELDFSKLKYAGESKPAPGRVFYNYDEDAFYFSSKQAKAADPDTWFKPMSGLKTRKLIDMDQRGRYDLPAKSADPDDKFVKGWRIIDEKGIKIGKGVFRTKKRRRAGIAILSVSGTYCSPKSKPMVDDPLTLDEDESEEEIAIHPTIRAKYKPHDGSKWKVAGQIGTLSIPPLPKAQRLSRCDDFSIESMVLLPDPRKNWDFGLWITRHKKEDFIINADFDVDNVLEF